MLFDSQKNLPAIGAAGLDYEHRELIRLTEALCERFDADDPREIVSDAFGALYAGASAHFALEERKMQENQDPGFAAHKADHERLLDRIRSMMEAFEAGMCADCGLTIRECLDAWLADHIKGADAELRLLAQ